MTLLSREVEGRLAVTGRRVDRRPGGEQRLDPRQIPGARRLAQRLARIVGACRQCRYQENTEENKAKGEKNGTAAARIEHGVPPEEWTLFPITEQGLGSAVAPSASEEEGAVFLRSERDRHRADLVGAAV
jgi:hypothetical protein